MIVLIRIVGLVRSLSFETVTITIIVMIIVTTLTTTTTTTMMFIAFKV